MEEILRFIIALREDTNTWEIIYNPERVENLTKMKELQNVYDALSKVQKSVYKKIVISETVYI